MCRGDHEIEQTPTTAPDLTASISSLSRSPITLRLQPGLHMPNILLRSWHRAHTTLPSQLKSKPGSNRHGMGTVYGEALGGAREGMQWDGCGEWSSDADEGVAVWVDCMPSDGTSQRTYKYLVCGVTARQELGNGAERRPARMHGWATDLDKHDDHGQLRGSTHEHWRRRSERSSDSDRVAMVGCWCRRIGGRRQTRSW